MRTNNYKVHINQLVGKYLVRMVKMNDLIQYAYAGSNATSINVIIDLYSIKNSVLGVDFEASGYDLCSAILDMVVHYKNYFRGLGVDPNFILIDSNNRPAGSISVYPNYNCDYAIKLTSGNYTGVKANINLLGQICDYLPNIQFIHTEHEVSVAAAYILENSNPVIPTMIISRDMYVSLLLDSNNSVTWLYPSKYNGQDVSIMADYRNNRVLAFNKALGMAAPNIPDDYLFRLPLSIIYAATKFPARGMRPVLQYRTLLSKIKAQPNIAWTIDDIENISSGAKIRFQTLDIPLQLEIYRFTAESSLVTNPAPKKYDTEGLKLINNELFAGTLQLDDLLR